ncbi:glycerol kinase 3-like protein, partial [Leptotrombidium deliense]
MCSHVPSYAKAVHISLVQSPNYVANVDYSPLLRMYFSIQRVVQNGDIISVDSKLDLSYFMKLKLDFRDLWPIIYFKVVQVEGDGCLIDVDNSNLYQTGTTRSFIPSLMPDFYGASDLNVGVFGKHIEYLRLLMFPYLSLLKLSAAILLSGDHGSGKSYVVKSVCKILNLHCFEVDINRILCDTASATETKMKLMFDKVYRYTPCVVLIENLEILCTECSGVDVRVAECFNTNVKTFKNELPAIFVIETNDPEVLLKSDYGSVFQHHMKLESLDEDERLETLRLLLHKRLLSRNVDLEKYSKELSGFVIDDLHVLVKKITANAHRRMVLEVDSDKSEIEAYLTADDFKMSIKEMEKSHREDIGAPNVPNVEWDDVGGLEDVRKEILETVRLPLVYKQLSDCGLRRSGVLLHGPPGTGKTLLAKAVASQCGLNFLSVKGPEIINMYVGQSEQNVRNIFQTARSAAPCIVFFDEIDSIAPNRGRSGDSGGVMDRVVSQLLAEVDGVHKNNHVFVIGATNRPDLLDPALLRPGRFDRLLYVGIPEGTACRLKILQALMRNFTLEDNFEMTKLEHQCPPSLSGADFYNLCSSAMVNAIERCIYEIEDKQVSEDDAKIIVQMSDFFDSIRLLKSASETFRFVLLVMVRDLGPLIGAIDQGTSSTRFLVFAARTGELVTYHQKEIKKIYVLEEWVEQNPDDIYTSVLETIAKVVEKLAALDIDVSAIKAVGLCNQRETTIVWDKSTGIALHNAIVWLDNRTKDIVDSILDGIPGRDINYFKHKTGLPISTYFSAFKLKWLFQNEKAVQEKLKEGKLLFGTVDTWILWKLTNNHLTDVSNASRTFLMDIETLDWDEQLCKFFNVPMKILPEIKSSGDHFGVIREGPLKGVPVSGVIGDQSSALIGQNCLCLGQTKATFGTGCFIMQNIGSGSVQSALKGVPLEARHSLVTTVAFKFGNKPAVYALEGSVAIAGAAITWLRDNLELIKSYDEVEPLAKQVPDAGGVYFVPAFQGLYAPYWDPNASGTIIGMSQFTKKAHIMRAVLESIAYQTSDILSLMRRSDTGISVDGGMSAND